MGWPPTRTTGHTYGSNIQVLEFMFEFERFQIKGLHASSYGKAQLLRTSSHELVFLHNGSIRDSD